MINITIWRDFYNRPTIKYLGDTPLDALRMSRMDNCETRRQTEREKKINHRHKI